MVGRPTRASALLRLLKNSCTVAYLLLFFNPRYIFCGGKGVVLVAYFRLLPNSLKDAQERGWKNEQRQNLQVDTAAHDLVKKRNKISGQKGVRRGRTSEYLFGWICQDFKTKGRFPTCLVRIVKANEQEDLKGADYFAEITEGFRIPIDVKASAETLKFFLKYLKRKKRARPEVIFIVVNPHRHPEEIFVDFLQGLERKRNELLSKRTAAE